MKITDITQEFISDSDHDFIDRLLESHIHNNHVFEKTYLVLHVSEIDHITDYLYRRYWEESYLRRDMSVFKSWNLSYEDIVMSIDECLQFIELALPPVLKPRIGEIQSVNQIIEIMNELLISNGDNDMLSYISVLKKVLHLQPFDTPEMGEHSSRYDRMMHLNKDLIQTVPIVLVDMIPCQLTALLQDSVDYSNIRAQLTFIFTGINSMQNMIRIASLIFLQSSSVHICNIKLETNGRLFIESYHDKLSKPIVDNIKLCYRWIK